MLFFTDNGRETACSPAGADALALESRPTVTSPERRRGRRGYAGLYYATSMTAHVAFPSWIARDEAMALDYDRRVRRYAASPFRLSWPEGSGRAHVPTFFVRRVDGSAVVVDCRHVSSASRAEVDAAVLQEIYTGMGWDYRLVSGHDRVWMTNLRWLAGYRHPRYDVPATARRLLAQFATPTPLMPGAHELGNPMAVLPVLYHLLWRQRLSADLSRVLDGATLVEAGPR